RPWRLPLAVGDEARDLAARLEARIEETVEPCQRGAITVELRALAPHRLLPSDTEPCQVLVDRLLVVRPAARHVDVLDAQQEAATGRARHVEVDERGERMAKMQITVRARRETEDGSSHAPPSGSQVPERSGVSACRRHCDSLPCSPSR